LDGFFLLSEIIAKQPRNTDAFNNRGLAYADLKQFKKAIQDYNQAIELNPKDFNTLLFLVFGEQYHGCEKH
jgi:tetratricopeptide (TPR) repeat protein